MSSINEPFCRICGKDLKDPDSIAIGIGPVCRIRIKNENTGGGTIDMFGEAEFGYSLDSDSRVLSIVDHDFGARSVTSDIENVLARISEWSGKSLAGYKVMYRDSMGIWDGVAVNKNGGFLGFFSLNERDSDKALNKLKKTNGGMSNAA